MLAVLAVLEVNADPAGILKVIFIPPVAVAVEGAVGLTDEEEAGVKVRVGVGVGVEVGVELAVGWFRKLSR